MPVIHSAYEGRTELRTAKKHYRCQYQRLSWMLDMDGLSICGAAILPGEQYVLETALPWSDAGPFYRTETRLEPVYTSDGRQILYHREVRDCISTVRQVRLCLTCARRESHAYRRHTGAF